MSSPEVEKFEITDDDLVNEFNPSRKKFRQSKNQTIYGIWAEEEDGDDRPKFSGGRGSKKKKNQDFMAPVSFVSGGIKIGDKVTKEADIDDQITDSDEEPEPVPAASMSRPRIGQGQGRSAYVHKKPSGDDGMGSWEKHTKGIGQKLLEKMGHVPGKGLGKNLQGISTPVEAVKRKGRGALGLYGTEKTERAERDFPTKPDSEEEEEKEFVQKLQQWKKGDESQKKKPKYQYKTLDELIAGGGKKKSREVQSDLAKVKVIDMTGKEQRVLSGYHAMSMKHDKPCDDDATYSRPQEKKQFDLPELLHNLDLLVDLAEDEIIQNDKKLKFEQDMIVNLDHERKRLAETCEQEEFQLTRLGQVLKIVEECEIRSQGCGDKESLERCAQLFARLQDEYYEEYQVYELSSLAVAIVFPLMKAEFDGWEPLKRPRHGLATIKQWKDILDSVHQPYRQGSTEQMQPYDRLIWEILIPYIRNTIGRTWNVRQPDSILEVLEAWMPLLPEWMMTNILEQLVFHKLHIEVEAWNPLTDTMPIHAWLHPWLPLMGERLEPLYAPIRHKLANALTNWHPSDPSAKLILQPWVGVFTRGHMDAFVVKNIVPKLALCLSEFIINPHQQQLDSWTWVMLWLDMVPQTTMAAILEKNFFPRWLHVLSTWLLNNPNYEEVTKWYLGWRNMFPEQLLGDTTIKEQLNNALEIMNRAVMGNSQPGARENVAYLLSTERRRDFEPQTVQPTQERRDFIENLRVPSASAALPTSMKDLVERRAEENNIVFMPIVNKSQEAKQVYKFGRIQIYFNRAVIMLFENNMWVPTSLNTLIDKGR